MGRNRALVIRVSLLLVNSPLFMTTDEFHPSITKLQPTHVVFIVQSTILFLLNATFRILLSSYNRGIVHFHPECMHDIIVWKITFHEAQILLHIYVGLSLALPQPDVGNHCTWMHVSFIKWKDCNPFNKFYCLGNLYIYLECCQRKASCHAQMHGIIQFHAKNQFTLIFDKMRLMAWGHFSMDFMFTFDTTWFFLSLVVCSCQISYKTQFVVQPQP